MPPPKNKKKTNLSFKDIEWRVNPKRKKAKRYETGIIAFDDWTGGLPYGLSIFLGQAGTGKSLMARSIAKECEKALYLACEVVSDAPEHKEYPNVETVNYTEYRVNWRRALMELEVLIDHYVPDLVVIDSITSFFSVTKKAVQEADISEGASEIHLKYDGQLPIIGISEVRGNGQYEGPAGGKGVAHANSMLIHFARVNIQFPSQEEAYGKSIGSDIYTMKVLKDKFNVAETKEAKVLYDGDGEYRISSAVKGRRD